MVGERAQSLAVTRPAPNGAALGVTDQLIAAATARGFKLSEREVRYRLQCARTYPTEAEIGNVIADFDTWFDLIQAKFPTYKAPDGEPPADHRTEAEREHDHARFPALALRVGRTLSAAKGRGPSWKSPA